MEAHQLAHSALSHPAQLHFYLSLGIGLFFCLIAMCALIGLVRTAHRRTLRDLWAASIGILGISLIASSIVLNAFVVPKPHHFTILIVPTSGLGVVLFVSGLSLALIGIFLTPTGEAGKWLPVNEKRAKSELTEAEVWPPAPKS